MGEAVSRTTVRSAIQTYLQGKSQSGNGAISSLSTVYGFPPKLTKEGDFFADDDPGTQSGAVIYLYIEHEVRKGIELRGAPAGGKLVDYTFILNCYFRSMKQKAEDAGADNETFLDSLVTAIELDKTAGAPGVIFHWGEGSGTWRGPDIEITSYYPRPLSSSAGVMQVYSEVRVHVVEQIANGS